MNRERWNIQNFDRINLPVVVGSINLPDTGSTRVLDMPVKMAGCNSLRLTDEVEPFRRAIEAAIDHETSKFGDIEDHYVYVTIDQKVVECGKTGRRAGAHSDAYIERAGVQIDITEESADVIAQETDEVSHTYIAYSNTPTEFFAAPFPLKDASCEGSLKTFDEIAEQSPAITYPCGVLLMMTPFVVHRCGIVQETGPRTFIKVSISRKKYARVENTHNPLFVYDWGGSRRDPTTRNHPWS